MSRPISIEEMVKQFKKHHTTSHLFKIDNFSLFRKHGIERVDSSVFPLAGHKWTLAVYPYGNESELWSFEKGHYVSVYLLNQSPIQHNIQPYCELFVVSQLEEDKRHSEGKWLYPSSDTQGMYWRGYHKFISHADLERNGYLIGDCCMFGVKFHVTDSAKSGTADCFSLIEKPLNHKVTWMMTKFSSFESRKAQHSNEFVVGNRKWRIEVHPRGCMKGKDKSFSVYLSAEGFINNAPKAKTYAKFKLRVLDQVSRNHVENTASAWLRAEPDANHGFADFMPLGNLREPYLVEDKLYVGVDFEVISIRNYL